MFWEEFIIQEDHCKMDELLFLSGSMSKVVCQRISQSYCYRPTT
jgi:hypothetical protein